MKQLYGGVVIDLKRTGKVNRGMVAAHGGSGRGGNGCKRELEARRKVTNLVEPLSVWNR